MELNGPENLARLEASQSPAIQWWLVVSIQKIRAPEPQKHHLLFLFFLLVCNQKAGHLIVL